MLDRLFILALVVVVVAVAIVAVRAWNARRVQTMRSQPATRLWSSLSESPDGRPTLVAFSSPSCATCHKAQLPAVGKVVQQLGASAIRVISVDVARQPEIARAFGVLTVPSTVVMAPAGHVIAINQGLAATNKLVQQLQRA
jgi:thioredoxin-like negative regulator of GroEL